MPEEPPGISASSPGSSEHLWEISCLVVLENRAKSFAIRRGEKSEIIPTSRVAPKPFAQASQELAAKDALAGANFLRRARRTVGLAAQRSAMSTRFQAAMLTNARRGRWQVGSDNLMSFPLGLDDERPLWVSRSCERWGIATGSLDLGLEFDLYRKPEAWSGYVVEARARALIAEPRDEFERRIAEDLERAVNWTIQRMDRESARRLVDMVPANFLGIAPLIDLADSYTRKTSGRVGGIRDLVVRAQECPVEGRSTQVLTNAKVGHGSVVFDQNRVAWLDSYVDARPGNFWPTPIWSVYPKNWISPTTESCHFLGKGIFVGSSKSWYHFIVESASRIRSCSASLGTSAPVVLPSGMPSQIGELCKLLTGFAPQEVAIHTCVHVESLAVAQSPRFDPREISVEVGEALLRLRTDILSRITGASVHGDRIFIRRPKNVFRPMWNQKAVEEVLVDYGFSALDPAELSLAEQVLAFRQARVVVGESGAALTNLMFCSPYAHFIQLRPVWEQGRFWQDFAQIFDVSHSQVEGQGRVWSSRGLASDGWLTSRQELEAALRVVLP